MTNKKLTSATIASQNIISDKIMKFLCDCLLAILKDHKMFHLEWLSIRNFCISKTVWEIRV